MELKIALLKLCQDSRISDIAVKEGEPVWARLNGNMRRLNTAPVKSQDIVDFLGELNPDLKISAEAAGAQLVKSAGDSDMTVAFEGYRLRVNFYLSDNRKLALAMRKLSAFIPDLKTLGLPPAFFTTMLNQTKGLILVTGATGSGKSTTLAATLQEKNKTEPGHIITLEQPVEYLLKSEKCLVDQREIGRDTDSFSTGLRAALREDPDIIMVGELRDYETVKIALTAATTGHLVLGSLHTNNARQSIERMASVFSPGEKDWVYAVLSQVLLGCISQTLVPRADGEGRVLAAELMVCTPDIQSAIRKGESALIFNAMDTGSSKGQLLLNRQLKAMVQQNIVKREDARQKTYDPVGLDKELGYA